MKKSVLLSPLVALLLLGAVLLTGCGYGRRSTKIYPDRDRFEVIGIDISAHNGDIDFRKVAAEGIDFAIIKATEGGTFKDKKFIDNIRLAREAGLKTGAYHFFRFDTPGYMQGLNFLNSVRGRQLDLPLVIDLEEWANPNSQPTAMVLNRLSEMIDHLESHGYRVMIYTNKNGFARFIKRPSRRLPAMDLLARRRTKRPEMAPLAGNTQRLDQRNQRPGRHQRLQRLAHRLGCVCLRMHDIGSSRHTIIG